MIDFEPQLTPEQQAQLEQWQRRAQENQARHGIKVDPNAEEKAAQEGRITDAQRQANEAMRREIEKREEEGK